MRTQTVIVVLGMACALLWVGNEADAAEASPDFFYPFPPDTDDAAVNLLPLRASDMESIPPSATRRRVLRPKHPPFVLRDGDRVLFLGDQLLRGEFDYGHLETRLTTQDPDVDVTFRNLSWLTNHPLATCLSAEDTGRPESWLDSLLTHAGQVRPTVVFLGFGTEAAAAGESGLTAFGANLDRLIDGLLTSPEYSPPRLVIMSTLSPRLASLSEADVEAQEAKSALYAGLLWELASARGCEFVDLYNWSWLEGRTSPALPRTHPSTLPLPMKDGLRLTQYGYWRITTVLEWALHWGPNTWRFGYLANNSLRSGQFGITLTHRSRSESHVTAITMEERLPTPNPLGLLDTEPAPRPRCYIQVTGLEPGTYILDVDGEQVVEGTEADWARFRIIDHGPSWDQAERLRQAVVRKNAALLRHWVSKDAPGLSGEPVDVRVEGLEAEIARLRRPVAHTYQVHRQGADAVQPRIRPKGPRIRRPSDGG